MAASERLLTRTASTCALETAHRTHIFKIDGYNLNRGFCIGKSIESATSVGSYDTCVRFYLDDHTEDNKHCVAVDIVLKTEVTEVRVLYDMWRVDRQGHRVSTTMVFFFIGKRPITLQLIYLNANP